MRYRDTIIFRDAAKSYKVWVLVRRTNRESLKYVGQPGYTPKRIDCKAKTATRDADGKQLAGLVVAPDIHTRAFTPSKLTSANHSWKKFMADKAVERSDKATPRDRGLEEARNLNNKKSQYTVDVFVKSKHFGCLKFQNQWIHGDYDLKDIVVPGHERRNIALVEELHGQPHMRGPKLTMVQDYVNRRIGSPMVQHGAEAQFADHADERIDVFGPNGEEFTLKNAKQTRLWYEKMQREVIDQSNRQPAQPTNDGLTPQQRRANFKVLAGGRPSG